MAWAADGAGGGRRATGDGDEGCPARPLLLLDPLAPGHVHAIEFAAMGESVEVVVVVVFLLTTPPSMRPAGDMGPPHQHQPHSPGRSG